MEIAQRMEESVASQVSTRTHTRTRRARPKGSETGYTPDLGMSMTQRIAHFLDWAAQHKPREFIPYNEILKAVQGYDHMPRLANREIDLVKGALTRAKKVLAEKYNRGYVAKPGVGVRATTDDFDRTKNALTKKAVKLGKAAAAFKAEHAAIDPSSIPNTAEAAPWRQWVMSSGRDLVKQLTEVERKLLPPGDPTPTK